MIATTEAQFQEQIVQLAHLHGWTVMHVRRSLGRRNGVTAWQTTTSLPGWPDLTLMRPTGDGHGELIFAELKSDRGRLRPEQRHVLAMLADCGQEAVIWRPRDLDHIAARLARHHHPGAAR